jgi:hypothetical protein
MKRISFFLITILLLVLPVITAHAQEPAELFVQVTSTGQLTTAAPKVVYSFIIEENNLRVGFVYDVTGDMEATLTVLGTDQKTILAGSSGAAGNGLIVKFPAAGTYFVELSATGGSSATYRLLIESNPPLPIDIFVAQSWLVAGKSVICSENAQVPYFGLSDEMNICFNLALITENAEVVSQWWSPSGELIVENTEPITPDDNFVDFLSGVVYDGTPYEAGWWQVHILVNGELLRIHWVSVE